MESKKSYDENLRCLCSQLLNKCSNVDGTRHCMLSLYRKFLFASYTIQFCALVYGMWLSYWTSQNVTFCRRNLSDSIKILNLIFLDQNSFLSSTSVLPFVEFHFAIRKTLCCLNAWRDKFKLCHPRTYSLPYLSAFALCYQHPTPVCPAIVETCPPHLPSLAEKGTWLLSNVYVIF